MIEDRCCICGSHDVADYYDIQFMYESNISEVGSGIEVQQYCCDECSIIGEILNHQMLLMPMNAIVGHLIEIHCIPVDYLESALTKMKKMGLYDEKKTKR